MGHCDPGWGHPEVFVLVLFVPDGTATASKRSSLTAGFICVVKSTRLDATSSALMACLTIVSPNHGAEAKEYASIIIRTEASGHPASQADIARRVSLEGLFGNTLV